MSAPSCLTDEDNLVLTDDHKKRFPTAMRILDLNIRLHPLQLTHKITAPRSYGPKRYILATTSYVGRDALDDEMQDRFYEELADGMKSE